METVVDLEAVPLDRLIRSFSLAFRVHKDRTALNLQKTPTLSRDVLLNGLVTVNNHREYSALIAKLDFPEKWAKKTCNKH
jgi:hypothetical protein